MKEKFINRYPLSKTLRFSLIPVGKTEENFNAKLLLEEDEKRAEENVKVKSYIDRYHRFYISSVLKDITLENVDVYADLYFKSSKNDSDLKAMSDLEAKLRKQIAKALTSHKQYKELFGQEIIENILPSFLNDDEEKASVEMFRGFFTYFSGFNSNRMNMYSDEPKSTAISYRCINDNLPKFLDNIRAFGKIEEGLSEDKIEELNETFLSIFGVYLTDIFTVDYFSFVLSQPGIDKYNGIIGGYTCSDGTKVQGINEVINLYNQQVAKSDKSKKLPLLKMLYKQILSDKETVSFIPEKFSSDDEVITAVSSFYLDVVKDCIAKLADLFGDFASYNLDGVFVRAGAAVTDISNSVFGNWSVVSDAWNKEYEEKTPLKKGKSPEKYYEEEAAAYKRIKSFSINELQRLGAGEAQEKANAGIPVFFSQAVANKVSAINTAYEAAKGLLSVSYSSSHGKKLCSDSESINLIKTLLDLIKELEWTVKPLLGTGKEENKDDVFYGDFIPLYDALSSVDRFYDKVRNYLTQKPYSKDKIKLNFENPQLLGGWDRNKERDYRTVLLRKDGRYYLAIMDKSNNRIFAETPAADGGDTYEKMEYKLLPGPNKMLPKVFFAKSNIGFFAPGKKILDIRAKESFKKGPAFNIDDCHEFIDFYKSSIAKHPDWSQFGFRFSPTESYKDISEFYREVSDQGYSIKFVDVPVSYIDSFVESGELYLFQIYNKDLSEYSHGTPNLHTLYFKALFDEKNLSDVVFKLNGESEMFYRKASINGSEKIVHPANRPIDNKNPDNAKRQSTFGYDLVKDRRFTKRQFSIHIPITLNFKSHGGNFINYDVRRALRECPSPYVIGIDRGERNLIYISVINDRGEIVEQMSLNEIIGDNGYKVDYQKLLDSKEKERDAARKSWSTVENIKELKEGYISQVVHKICELVIKYDAVIAMEDLNFGFKRGRFGVEKQVYQKFENMLISKLNYLCDKKADPGSEGGVLRAYQLTNKFDGVNKGRQNGIIFYVPAWLTSKIDPVTGFADLLHPRYGSVKETLDFLGRFDDIRYNPGSDMFEFELDYDKFPKCNADYRKKWTVCTNADRIRTFRNPAKNNEWDNQRVILTDEFKKLFEEFGIDYRAGLKESVLSAGNTDFLRRFMSLLALTLQMRNSITGSTNPEDDYLISPVMSEDGSFYDSRDYSDPGAALPADADANGAYNIARKGLWAIERIRESDEETVEKTDLSVSNAGWLEYVQS